MLFVEVIVVSLLLPLFEATRKAAANRAQSGLTITDKFTLPLSEFVIGLVALIGVILLANLGSTSMGDISPEAWGWIAIKVPMHVAAMVLLFYVLSIRNAAAFALPFLYLTPVIVGLIGPWFLGSTEQLAPMQWLGMLIILVTAFTLFRRVNKAADADDVSAIRKAQIAIIVTAFLWGITSVIDKVVVVEHGVAPMTYVSLIYTGAIIFFMLLLGMGKYRGEGMLGDFKPLSTMRIFRAENRLKLVLLVGLGNATAEVIQMYALHVLPHAATVLATKRAAEPLVVILLAVFWGERKGIGASLLAFACMALGWWLMIS